MLSKNLVDNDLTLCNSLKKHKCLDYKFYSLPIYHIFIIELMFFNSMS